MANDGIWPQSKRGEGHPTDELDGLHPRHSSYIPLHLLPKCEWWNTNIEKYHICKHWICTPIPPVQALNLYSRNSLVRGATPKTPDRKKKKTEDTTIDQRRNSTGDKRQTLDRFLQLDTIITRDSKSIYLSLMWERYRQERDGSFNSILRYKQSVLF